MKRIIATVVLALFLAQVQYTLAELSESDLSGLHQIFNHSGCMTEENLTFDEVTAFATGGSVKDIEDNTKAKCFAACFFKYMGVLDGCSLGTDDNNKFFTDDEHVKQMREHMEKCKESLKGDDRCECAYQMSLCLEELSKDGEGEDTK